MNSKLPESQPMTPEQEKALFEKKQQAMFSAVRRMKGNSLQQASSVGSTMISTFSSEQVDRFMKNPAKFEKELRQLSNYLYDYSPEYRQIIDYMSLLPSFNYVLDSLEVADEKTNWVAMQKAKLKVAKEIDKMSLSHELSKALRVAWKEDVFYGYEHETKDSYLIQHMNADHCRLSSQDFDGVFLYEFDFSIFDRSTKLLESYPEEFYHKYQTYKNTGDNWIELNPDKAFAFKINEEITSYSLLPYSILFEPIFDLDEYKRIQKARVKMDNFMLLVQKIPLDDKSQNMDQFLVSLELAEMFHNQAASALGDGIGLITSPLEVEAIKTDQSGKQKDSVSMALREVYNAGGVSQFLFNSDKSTSVGVNKSIIVDEQGSFKLLRQIERWINRKIRKISGRYKFKLSFLDMTSFDEGESFELYLKAAQNGFPVIEHTASSIGISPLELHNRLMSNTYGINYQEMMQPLATSHTQSSDDKDKTGAPTKSDNDISDSGQINRDANTDEEKSNK